MSKNINFIIAAIFGSISAFCQQDSTNSKPLDVVVVTANKLPQKQRTTGKVISIVTKEQIEKSGGKSLGQLLNEQAGITISGALNNGGTNQSLFMRGAASGRTLVLIDGIPVYDPSLINNEFDLNLVSLNNVECIEICRGAQSTLYGSDAVAGVVNIVTVKENQTKRFDVRASASAGSYNTYKTGLDVAGKAGNFSYSIKYSKISTSGFSAAFDSTKNEKVDTDGFKGQIVNATIKYNLTSSITAKAFAQYSYNNTELDAAAFIDEKDYYFTNRALISGVGMVYRQDKVNLTVNYQHSKNKRLFFNDSIDVPGFTKFSTDNYSASGHFVEAYAKVNVGGGFSVLQGADFRISNMQSQYFSLSSSGPYTTEFKDTSHSQGSIYGSIFYNGLNEKLNVDLGGRLNVHSEYGSNSTFTINPTYLFSDHYRILGSVATAFKTPTLYQLYSTYGNRSLKPERSITYELGMEQRHGKLSNRVVYFQRRITEGIDFNYLSFKYFNTIEQIVKGIELETKVQPTKAFAISLNYTYLNPEERSQSHVTFKDTTYQYLLRRPNHHININAGNSFENGLYLSIGAKYVSKRYDIGGYKTPDIPLDHYLLLNAYAQVKFTKWIRVFVDAQNITGKKFFDVRGYNSIPFLCNAGLDLTL